MDEGSGTAAADSSGYGNNATLGNSPTWLTSGLPSVNFTDAGGLSFDGTTNYVTLGTGNIPANNAAQTISVWAKLSSTAGTQNLIALTNLTNSGVQLEIKAGSIGAYNWGGGALVSTSAPTTGQWHHVAYTYDGASNQTLYVDGVATTATVANQTGSVTFAYLGTYSPLNELYSGSLDEVRIYSRALTATEIYSLYLGNQPGTYQATQTMTGSPTVTGDLTIASGTLAIGTNTVSVNGSWWNYGGLFTATYGAGGGTVAFAGTGTTNYILSAGQLFPQVNVTGSGTWTLAGAMDVDPARTVSLSAGAVNGSQWTLRGTTVGTGGTFTPATGTVIANGSSNATLGPTTFNNLRIEDPTETNLVGYWKLDEGQGASTYDWTGAGHVGTLAGGAKWSTSVPGGSRIDYYDPYAVSLNGSTGYVDGGAAATPTNAAYTACAWVNFNTLTNHHAVLTIDGSNVSAFFLKRDGGTHDFAMGIYATDSTGAASYWAGGGVGATTVLTGVWYHVCGVYTGSVVRLYVNGTQEGTDTTVAGSFNATGHTTIGSDLWSGSHSDFVDGTIDDVRVYNVALTAAQIKQLGNGRYANTGGTATVTIGANTTVSGTLDVDNGTINPGAHTLTASNGLTVRNAGTLKLDTASGAVAIASGKTLTIDGTLNASTASATIKSVSGNYAFQVGSTATATPTVTITGLAIKNTDTNGMWINQNTSATTSISQFDKIAFSNGTGSTLLQIYAPSLSMVSSGCSFDGGQASGTTTYNVTLTGNGISDGETRAFFGGATCATNRTPCASYKSDDDPTGTGTGAHTTTNGAVVHFVPGVSTDTAGVVQGFPTAAFDWTTYTYYATYVAFRSANGTASRVFVRNTSGDPSYYWDGPSGDDIIGTPRWNTESGSHYVYVATTGGKVYRLLDNGSSLAPDNTGNWAGANNPFDCSCSITTPLANNGSNLYWGGVASATQKLWTLGISARAQPSGSPIVVTPTITSAAPSVWTSGDTYSFLGMSGHIYKIDVTQQSGITDNSNPAGSVTGRLVIYSGKVYATDDTGNVWRLDAASCAGTAKDWTYHDNTNHSGCAAGSSCSIKSGAYYDFSTTRLFFGDQDGHLYGVNATTGALRTGYPWRGSVSDVISTAPLATSGVVVVGTTNGWVYVVDQNNGAGPALYRTYYFGASEAVSSIGYDVSAGNYLISTSNTTNKDGRIYVIGAASDPTPGAP